jgi:hypothetical protein
MKLYAPSFCHPSRAGTSANNANPINNESFADMYMACQNIFDVTFFSGSRKL